MAYAADLDHQLAAEDRTKQRQYVLSGTRGRWRVLGLGVVLLVAGAALVPMLSRLVARLRATRTTFARLEAGDLTARVPDDAPDELGYLGVSLNRTTDGIAAIVRQVQHQGRELATLGQQLAASARQVQTASQGISTTTQGLTRGAARQRERLGHA